MKGVLSTTAVALIGLLSACAEPTTTRGDIRDMEIADETRRCANQYLGRPNSGPNTEIWIMCVQISANQGGRDVLGVARQVIRQTGWNVFEFAERDGSNDELSEAGRARLESGE